MDSRISSDNSQIKQHRTTQYSVSPETFCHPDMGEYHTYGIRITTTDILHDVTTCEETANHIVELINHCQLSPDHLYDVIIDMLL